MLTKLLQAGQITLGLNIDSLNYDSTPDYIRKICAPVNVAYKLKLKVEINYTATKNIYFNFDSRNNVISIIHEITDPDYIQAKLIEVLGPCTHSTQFNAGIQTNSMKGWIFPDFFLAILINDDRRFLIQYDGDKKSFFTYPIVK